MTEILPATSKQAIRKACRLMHEGEAIAFPTDTVYGLGAKAFERFAVRQVFHLKQRDRNKGVPIFIPQIDDLNLVARNVPNSAWPLLQHFWPGSLTVVLQKTENLPDDVTGGEDTVAIRIPDHPICFELLTKMGCPIVATSANLANEPTPDTAQGVADQLGEQLPLVLDGGPSPTAYPSTIIDLSTTPPRLLRSGPIKPTDLQKFIPDLALPE